MSRKLHVLLIGPFPWPSHQGSQAYLAGQARALVARGHRVTVAVYGGGEAGGLPGVTLLRGRRVPFGSFDAGGLHWSRPLADLQLVRAIRRYARGERVDVLHAHNVEGPVVGALTGLGIPLVYDLHTRMEDELASHLPRRVRRWGPPLGALLDRLALGRADAGCAISRAAVEVFDEAGLPSRWVGPAMSVSELQARPDARRRFGLPDRFVVYTGNLDAYQDLGDLLQVRHRLDAPLVVVTGSPSALPEDVLVVRSRAFQDALDVLSVASVAVIPRRSCAGFPIKLLNQLGMTTVTVMPASSAPALPGVVPYTSGDPSPTINRLLADPMGTAKLGVEASEHVRRTFCLDAVGRRLETLYASVIPPRSSHGGCRS